ncbi:MAG: YbhB/YbcL family Raf kinase inhibitor-like protein [Candidatus Aminicenantes bacterium]|nr:YbhB/YbcL family Raf kinase inhibitor-like protein [Candidatus Aminicenantes bacterium]
MQIMSKAFNDSKEIPQKYTCDGDNVSPPLEWLNIPEETKTLALICDDPDAPMGTWVHWVIFNIPADADRLPEGIPPEYELDNGICQGMSDFKKVGYGGPCPPSGTHRYFFKIYALDSKLDLPQGATKAHVMIAMEGHVLALAHLMGTYRR